MMTPTGSSWYYETMTHDAYGVVMGAKGLRGTYSTGLRRYFMLGRLSVFRGIQIMTIVYGSSQRIKNIKKYRKLLIYKPIGQEG